MPILVTFRIALALRNQMPVVRHIGVVDVALHDGSITSISKSQLICRKLTRKQQNAHLMTVIVFLASLLFTFSCAAQ